MESILVEVGIMELFFGVKEVGRCIRVWKVLRARAKVFDRRMIRSDCKINDVDSVDGKRGWMDDR